MKAVGYLVGSGSMSLGVEQAGFELQSVYETPGYSKNAATWDLNRPEIKHCVQDLDPMATFIGADESTDLVYGNPPCGGLSSTTGAKHTSKTNKLMQHWLAMVLRSRPRMLLMENAFQLATKAGAPIRDRLVAELDAAGYDSAVWLFHSWQLGTPQMRRRCFLVALRDYKFSDDMLDSGKLHDPSDGYPREVQLQYALRDLLDVTPSPDPINLDDGRVITQHYWSTKGVLTSKLFNEHGDRLLRMNFIGPLEMEKLSAKARDGDKKAVRELERRRSSYWPDAPKLFANAKRFRTINRTDPSEPSMTVISEYNIAHPTINRVLTMRELARLMGFPDDWRFHNLDPRLIAQGVPVANAKWAASRLMKALATAHQDGRVRKRSKLLEQLIIPFDDQVHDPSKQR